ncbi:MAG: hypothetical protein ABSB35_39165 [Bryobacteraceae bacterium]|jgi:hypothetical protein
MLVTDESFRKCSDCGSIVLPEDSQVNIRVEATEVAAFRERSPAWARSTLLGGHFPPATDKARIVCGGKPLRGGCVGGIKLREFSEKSADTAESVVREWRAFDVGEVSQGNVKAAGRREVAE